MRILCETNVLWQKAIIIKNLSFEIIIKSSKKMCLKFVCELSNDDSSIYQRKWLKSSKIYEKATAELISIEDNIVQLYPLCLLKKYKA